MSLTPECGSVHTHSVLCDGKGTLAEMAAAAYQAGVRYFGASGHSHTEIPHDAGNVLPADPAEYRAPGAGPPGGIRRADGDPAGASSRTASPPSRCRTGRTTGSAPSTTSGTRRRGNTTVWTGTGSGWPPAGTGCSAATPLAMTEGYYADVAAMAARGPTILGHMDLVTKLNRGNAFFDEEDPRYQAAALEALHHADPGPDGAGDQHRRRDPGLPG